MTRLIIDTDPGVDDAHAIMLAFAHPQARVEAIATVAGNVSLERTTANACTILDALGKDVPIYAGCERAIISRTGDASYVHGTDGLGDSGFPSSSRQVSAEHAVNALIRMASESPDELTLVAIGPLTNIALATRLDPQLPQKYKRLVVMGGAIRATGNMPSPSTEFNIFTDPEAAAIVFGAWPGLTLISWETTLAYGLAPEQITTLTSFDSPRAEFFRRITRRTLDFIQQALGRTTLFAPDPLAVAISLEPDIVRKAEMHFVQVELAGQHTRGQTTVDWFSLAGKHTPNANIVLEIDTDRFWELMQAAVR
jgi:purine nucleosidase